MIRFIKPMLCHRDRLQTHTSLFTSTYYLRAYFNGTNIDTPLDLKLQTRNQSVQSSC